MLTLARRVLFDRICNSCQKVDVIDLYRVERWMTNKLLTLQGFPDLTSTGSLTTDVPIAAGNFLLQMNLSVVTENEMLGRL